MGARPSDTLGDVQKIGAHVGVTELGNDPLSVLAERGADAVQIFIGSPQTWAPPQLTESYTTLAEALRENAIALYVHAPYLINIASTNNRVRIPSRKMLAQQAEAAAELGAQGLIVHGGHVPKDSDISEGFTNWRKLFSRAAESFALPILIENTAGGSQAMARYLEQIEHLWDAIGEFSPGFCLDTAHAHAAGLELDTVVDDIKKITGRIDLIHANNSKDTAGSGRDRHANFESGVIDPAKIVSVVKTSDADAIVETPPPAQAQAADIAYLRDRL